MRRPLAGQAGREKPLREFPLSHMLRETERVYREVFRGNHVART